VGEQVGWFAACTMTVFVAAILAWIVLIHPELLL
jgi:hypothetical protein